MIRWLQASLLSFSTILFNPLQMAIAETDSSSDSTYSETTLKKRANFFISEYSPLTSASFSNDNSVIAAASTSRYGKYQNFLKIWNLDTFGTPEETINIQQNNSINSSTFNPDGSLLATLSPDFQGNVIIKLWNLRDLKDNGSPTLVAVNRHGKDYSRVKAEFSPDGTLLMTVTHDNNVRLWSINNSSSTNVMKLRFNLNHKNTVTNACFSPDGKMILTTSHDQTAKLWRLNNANTVPQAQILPHLGTVYKGTFSPDGGRILTASKDRTASLWNTLDTRNILSPLKVMSHDNEVKDVAFSPDGSLMITSSGNNAKVWTFNEKSALKRIAIISHQNTISQVLFRPGSQQLLINANDYDKSAFFTLWDLENIRENSPPKTIVSHKHKQEEQKSIDPVFSNDGKLLITSMPNGSAMIWQFSKRKR